MCLKYPRGQVLKRKWKHNKLWWMLLYEQETLREWMWDFVLSSGQFSSKYARAMECFQSSQILIRLYYLYVLSYVDIWYIYITPFCMQDMCVGSTYDFANSILEMRFLCKYHQSLHIYYSAVDKWLWNISCLI